METEGATTDKRRRLLAINILKTFIEVGYGLAIFISGSGLALASYLCTRAIKAKLAAMIITNPKRNLKNVLSKYRAI